MDECPQCQAGRSSLVKTTLKGKTVSTRCLKCGTVVVPLTADEGWTQYEIPPPPMTFDYSDWEHRFNEFLIESESRRMPDYPTTTAKRGIT